MLAPLSLHRTFALPQTRQEAIDAATAAHAASLQLLGQAEAPNTATQPEMHDLARRLAESLHAVLSWMPRPDTADQALFIQIGDWL